MSQRKKRAIAIYVVVLILAFVLLSFIVGSTGSQSSDTSSAAVSQNPPPVQENQPVVATTQSPATSPASAPPPADTSKYKDGTYTAVGRYNSPAGLESINVSITIANDIVTSSSVTPLAGDGRSMGYQEMFVSGYKQYVVGKPIDSIELNTVSGSSLTPKGFNNALATIKSEALAS